MYACKMPGRVYAGADALHQLAALCSGGRRVVVFSDRSIQRSGVLDLPLRELDQHGIAYELLTDLYAEPTCDQAQAVVDAFRRTRANTIVAVGGGSVMDIAKLCAVAADPSLSVRALLADSSIARKSAFTVMIPTTAGTGAEATPNAIVAVPEKALKVGIVCEAMIPDVVILDGVMIRSLPLSIAASTGVDALCHALECYTSAKATSFSDLYATQALKLIFTHLEAACLDKDAVRSRDAMLLAAYYAGVAITSSGTTAVHALSYPLGGRYHIPHGVANAMMLMPVMRFNLPFCRPHFARIYGMLGWQGKTTEAEKAEALLEAMQTLVQRLRVPTNLKSYGVTMDDLDALVAAGMDVQRLLRNNLRPVTEQDARALYMQLLT